MTTTRTDALVIPDKIVIPEPYDDDDGNHSAMRSGPKIKPLFSCYNAFLSVANVPEQKSVGDDTPKANDDNLSSLDQQARIKYEQLIAEINDKRSDLLCESAKQHAVIKSMSRELNRTKILLEQSRSENPSSNNRKSVSEVALQSDPVTIMTETGDLDAAPLGSTSNIGTSPRMTSQTEPETSTSFIESRGAMEAMSWMVLLFAVCFMLYTVMQPVMMK